MSLVSKSQPIHNDTVICIIDTTNDYIKYIASPCANRNPKCRWQITIKGHYYDIERPMDKDFACIVFDADDLRSIYKNDYKGSFSIRMSKEKIRDNYIVETDEWINKQTNMKILGERIGYYPFSKYNFVVFKQDFDNAKSDSVIMHRVSMGYNEIVN
jgi:hypothetical protein